MDLPDVQRKQNADEIHIHKSIHGLLIKSLIVSHDIMARRLLMLLRLNLFLVLSLLECEFNEEEDRLRQNILHFAVCTDFAKRGTHSAIERNRL